MSAVQFFKVGALPGTLQPHSFYFVQNGAYAEAWLTDNFGVPKAVGNTDMITDIAGSGSNPNVIVHTAGETISALRACFIDDGLARKSDSSELFSSAGVVGVSITAAVSGSPISIQTFGVLTDGSWSWGAAGNPTIWLGADGVLTQTFPASGYGREVATALSDTSIFINPRGLIAI